MPSVAWPEIFWRLSDRADDAIIDRLRIGFGKAVLTEHAHVAEDASADRIGVIRSRFGVSGPHGHTLALSSIYEAAGGENGLLRLAKAWHARVVADEVVGHAFSHGLRPDHTRRLAAYWAEALGGPSAYSDRYSNETSVVRLHSGNGRHEEMDRRAIVCFDQALEDAGLAADEVVQQALHDYFAWATTTTMAQYPESADAVPAGLPIPRWSWDGLQVG